MNDCIKSDEACLLIMIKPASSACNLRCKYCFYIDEAQNRKIPAFPVMTETIITALLKHAFESSSYVHFIFQGGEPTLVTVNWFKKFIELERVYNTKGIRVDHSLQTNGTLIDDAWAEFLYINRFFVGVSFDGNNPIQNIQRPFADGRGSSRAAIRGIEILVRHQVITNILVVVTDLVVENIKSIVDWFLYNKLLYLQFIPCLDPLQGPENYFLSPKKYGEFLIELFDHWLSLYWTETPMNIRLFENFLGICIGIEPEACDMKGHCSKQFVIEGDGSVYPCDFYCLDEWKLGSIIKQSFHDFTSSPVMDKFLHRSDETPIQCKNCPYFYLCRNGCPRYRDKNNHFRFCESYRMFFSHCLPELKELAMLVKNNTK